MIPADVVIIAFGFRPNPPSWLAELSVDVHEDGPVRASGSRERPLQTTNPSMFADGDMVRGVDLVVTAMFEGGQSAQVIAKVLKLS